MTENKRKKGGKQLQQLNQDYSKMIALRCICKQRQECIDGGLLGIEEGRNSVPVHTISDCGTGPPR